MLRDPACLSPRLNQEGSNLESRLGVLPLHSTLSEQAGGLGSRCPPSAKGSGRILKLKLFHPRFFSLLGFSQPSQFSSASSAVLNKGKAIHPLHSSRTRHEINKERKKL